MRLAALALLLSACGLWKPVIVCPGDDPRCPLDEVTDASSDSPPPPHDASQICTVPYVDSGTPPSISFVPCDIACGTRCVTWNTHPGCQVCCMQLDLATQGSQCSSICDGQCVVDSESNLYCCQRIL